MAYKIPAGRVAEVGKYRVDASLIFGIAEQELYSVILLGHGVHRFNNDSAEGARTAGDLGTQDQVITDVNQRDDSKHAQRSAAESTGPVRHELTRS